MRGKDDGVCAAEVFAKFVGPSESGFLPGDGLVGGFNIFGDPIVELRPVNAMEIFGEMDEGLEAIGSDELDLVVVEELETESGGTRRGWRFDERTAFDAVEGGIGRF